MLAVRLPLRESDIFSNRGKKQTKKKPDNEALHLHKSSPHRSCFIHYINIFNCFNRKNIKQFNFGILHFFSSLQTHNIQYTFFYFFKHTQLFQQDAHPYINFSSRSLHYIKDTRAPAGLRALACARACVHVC